MRASEFEIADLRFSIADLKGNSKRDFQETHVIHSDYSCRGKEHADEVAAA
jgi:hypothetical protein